MEIAQEGEINKVDFVNRVYIWKTDRKKVSMGDVSLFVKDVQSISAILHCRICHEEEFESSKTLEAPCACSGTVKVNQSSALFYWVLFCLFFFFWIPSENDLGFCFMFYSLRTGIVFKGGATRKEIQHVKSVLRYEFRRQIDWGISICVRFSASLVWIFFSLLEICFVVFIFALYSFIYWNLIGSDVSSFLFFFSWRLSVINLSFA